MKRAIIIGVIASSHNAAAFTLNALVLRRTRRLYPELFNGPAAAASVAAALAANLEEEAA